jgi:integrase
MREILHVTRGDIERMQADIVSGKTANRRHGRGGHTTGGEGVACRSVSTLHAIFEHGIRQGLIENNPARGARKIAERKRDRRLSQKEIIHLGGILSQCLIDGENPTGIAAIKFVLLSGFRRMEALTLKRAWLDPTVQCVRFPDTKAGKQIRSIGKSAAALIRTQCLKRKSDHVFPSDTGDGHFIGVARVLERVTKKAGFSDVTLHTLRHTFASIGAELGFTELTLAGLLGHSARGVTQRYIHLDEALQVAADRISGHIDQLLAQGAKSIRQTRKPHDLASQRSPGKSTIQVLQEADSKAAI